MNLAARTLIVALAATWPDSGGATDADRTGAPEGARAATAARVRAATLLSVVPGDARDSRTPPSPASDTTRPPETVGPQAPATSDALVGPTVSPGGPAPVTVAAASAESAVVASPDPVRPKSLRAARAATDARVRAAAAMPSLATGASVPPVPVTAALPETATPRAYEAADPTGTTTAPDTSAAPAQETARPKSLQTARAATDARVRAAAALPSPATSPSVPPAPVTPPMAEATTPRASDAADPTGTTTTADTAAAPPQVPVRPKSLQAARAATDALVRAAAALPTPGGAPVTTARAAPAGPKTTPAKVTMSLKPRPDVIVPFPQPLADAGSRPGDAARPTEATRETPPRPDPVVVARAQPPAAGPNTASAVEPVVPPPADAAARAAALRPGDGPAPKTPAGARPARDSRPRATAAATTTTTPPAPATPATPEPANTPPSGNGPESVDLSRPPAMAQNSSPAPGVTENAPAAVRELLRGYARTALQNNPQLLQNEADSRAAEHRIGEARGNLYPRVALSATASNERQDREQTQVVTFDQRAGQVRVIMPLYDRTAKAQLAQRQSASVSADWRLTDVREQLMLRVVESYIELVRSLRLATLAQENLKTHRAYVAQIKEIARFDVGRSADVSTAVARTSLAESVLISRVARLDAARTQWRQVTGTSAPADLPDAYAVDLPPDLDSVLAVALTGHPALQLAQADIVVARDGVELAAAPYKPRLNIEANSRFGSDWGGFVGTQTSRYVGVSAEIPVFSGFSDRYAGKAAAEQVQSAQHAYDRIRDELRRRTEQAWYDLQSNAASLRSFEDYARSAQSMVEATRNQFRIGRRTLLDVLNAENELFTARSNIASTRQDLTLASWRLHSVRGRVAAELDL